MLLNNASWPKFGYLEPNPGHLIPIKVARRSRGISAGQYLGTATISGHTVPVIAPVKGYTKIWHPSHNGAAEA